VRYQASLTPPEPPYGYLDYDSYLSEDSSRWAPWNPHTTVSADGDQPEDGEGTHSLKLTYERTVTSDEIWPASLPLAYLLLPVDWRDMSGGEWGAWRAKAKMRLSIGGVVKSETDLPQSGVKLWYVGGEGSLVSPSRADGTWDVGNIASGEYYHPAWSSWGTIGFIPARQLANPPSPPASGAHTRYVAIGLGYYYWGTKPSRRESQSEMVGPPTVSAGQTIRIEIWIDDMAITSKIPGFDDVVADDSATEAPPTIEAFVESAEVTAGTEIPAEDSIGTSGLSRREARKLAIARLAEINKTRISVSGIDLDGIRTIPMRSRVNLVLPNRGLPDVTYPLSELTYKLLEAGDVTELTAGSALG
jgi:hypothetical protein